MESKYDMTIEEAYEKIAELELLIKKIKIAANYHVKLEGLLNNLNDDQTVYIYIEDYDNNAYKDTGIVINPFDNFYNNENVMKYKDCYVHDMWACGEDKIKVVIGA